MAKFQVYDTFSLTQRNLLVLYGTAEEGVIDAGMIVHVPLNSATSVTAPIASIEKIDRYKESFLGLCIRYEDLRERDIWFALNIGNEQLEITETE